MKTLKYILFGWAITFLVGCTEGEKPIKPEAENLILVKTFSNDHHKIEFYTANGRFQTGYNTVYFKIKNADGKLVNDAIVSWIPVMKMVSKSHSCPVSSIAKMDNGTYVGYMVFQMAGNDSEKWELTLKYTTQGKEYTAVGSIEVVASEKRSVESFSGADGNRYVLAMADPLHPKVGTNDMKAVLYRMENMMSFVSVGGHTIKIDPRMPAMGNHSSPNNVDLVEGPVDIYRGKLNLTMTGYWKVNLQVLDDAKKLLKGEEVTDDHQGSSIYFEVEF